MGHCARERPRSVFCERRTSRGVANTAVPRVSARTMQRASTGVSLRHAFVTLLVMWCAAGMTAAAPRLDTNKVAAPRLDTNKVDEADDNDLGAGHQQEKGYKKSFLFKIPFEDTIKKWFGLKKKSTTTSTTTTTTTTTTPAPTTTTAVTKKKSDLSVIITRKVNVVVVYESHCPFSRRFIYGQLYPTYQKLKDFMNVKILPFGKAHVDNVNATVPHFTCQHGSNECMGNMMETCVVNVVKEQLTAIKILACMSSSYQPHLAGPKCVEGTGYKWTKIQKCVTEKGTKYLLQVGLETWKIQSYVARVPLVVVDGQMDNYVEYYAQTNMMTLICEHIPYEEYQYSPCGNIGRRRRR